MVQGTDGDVVVPSSFKEVLCIFAPQFKGSEQHDSQEFLAFLLDSIHEDMNNGLKIPGGRGYLQQSIPSWLNGRNKDDDDDDESMPEAVNNFDSIRPYLLFFVPGCRRESMGPLSFTQRFLCRFALSRYD
jgi:hypothetical protein